MPYPYRGVGGAGKDLAVGADGMVLAHACLACASAIKILCWVGAHGLLPTGIPVLSTCRKTAVTKCGLNYFNTESGFETCFAPSI